MFGRRFFLFLSVALLPATSVSAADYKPVVCASAKPYQGAAQPDLNLTGELKALTETKAAATPAFAPDRTKALDEAFAAVRTRVKAKALTAAVLIPGRSEWSQTMPDSSAPLFFWASAGKTFTAVAILQMEEEGKLSLDAPISDFVPDVPNGKAITLRHLLTHTSGLFSSNEDLKLRYDPKPLTLQADVAVLKKHGAMFCPGENWRYSNSGYHLLGAAIEKVDAKPYDQAIRARIIDRLGLKATRALTPDDALSDVVRPALVTDEPALDPRVPGPAGAIAASAPDMTAFWQGLLGGRLLRAQTVQDMFASPYPMFGQPPYYAEGVMIYALPPEGAGGSNIWLGHSGGAPGVKAVVAYSLEAHAYVAVAMTGDGSAEAAAHLLLSAVK